MCEYDDGLGTEAASWAQNCLFGHDDVQDNMTVSEQTATTTIGMYRAERSPYTAYYCSCSVARPCYMRTPRLLLDRHFVTCGVMQFGTCPLTRDYGRTTMALTEEQGASQRFHNVDT